MLAKVLRGLFTYVKQNGSIRTVNEVVHIQGKDGYGNPSQHDVPIKLSEDDVNDLRKFADVDSFMKNSSTEITLAVQFASGLGLTNGQ
jgi:hypothetical protein